MSKGVALIGCGRIAKRHAHVLGEIEGVHLQAVCDIIPERAGEFGSAADVPWGCNMHALVEHSRPDIISVLTPSGLHSQHVIELAQYGVPIIVEKPMALTLEDADAMIGTCALYDTPLFVVKQNRFNLPIVLLREAIEADLFGELVSATVCVRWCRHADYYQDWHGTWEMAGGVLANQASHHIDILQWMMGEPENVFAYATTNQDIAVEDLLMGVVHFKSDALGSIEVTTATRPKDTEGSITILGEKGMVKVGGFACNRLETWQFESEEDINISTYTENPPDVYGFGHKAYYEHVLRCLDGKAEPLVGGTEARKGLALTIALYQSVEEGCEIGMDKVLYSWRLGR
jgi:UDP-N-acetyl-2-amino-2-deoxyglucuronate dehydrogenase